MRIIKNCVICKYPVVCRSIAERSNRKYCSNCGKQQHRNSHKISDKKWREDPFNRTLNSFKAIRANPIKMIRSIMY